MLLVPQFISDLVDSENFHTAKTNASGALFIGVGTLLNQRLPANPKIIFGSGVGYGNPQVDAKWHIYFVRGPLSADALGLDKSYAITDPVILLRALKLPAVEKRYKCSFMPHHDSLNTANWAKVCRDLDIHFIDPTASFEEGLHQLMASELVICEAMHAAIIADTLNIPWVPITLHRHINEFKWKDWCQSVGVDYAPTTLPYPLRLIRHKMNRAISQRLIRPLNNLFAHYGLYRSKKAVPQLSDVNVKDELVTRILARIDLLRSDFSKGKFL
ncbi:MAG: ExoV-like protein [Halothiobacillaceae bacterium]|nr:MAG: ExoV-like protein [Halothiobacillaceae bacterium]